MMTKASDIHRLLVCLVALLPACRPPITPVEVGELVTSYRVDPVVNTFERPVNIRYTLHCRCLISLRITKEQDNERYLVYVLQEDQQETSGAHLAAWRGIGEDGFFVPKGTYTVELYARPSKNHQTQQFNLPVQIYRQ